MGAENSQGRKLRFTGPDARDSSRKFFLQIVPTGEGTNMFVVREKVQDMLSGIFFQQDEQQQKNERKGKVNLDTGEYEVEEEGREGQFSRKIVQTTDWNTGNAAISYEVKAKQGGRIKVSALKNVRVESLTARDSLVLTGAYAVLPWFFWGKNPAWKVVSYDGEGALYGAGIVFRDRKRGANVKIMFEKDKNGYIRKIDCKSFSEGLDMAAVTNLYNALPIAGRMEKHPDVTTLVISGLPFAPREKFNFSMRPWIDNTERLLEEAKSGNAYEWSLIFNHLKPPSIAHTFIANTFKLHSRGEGKKKTTPTVFRAPTRH